MLNRCNACDGTVFTNASPRLSGYPGVLFFLDHDQLMHFGDHFFFKPLITKLAASGIPIAVRPTESLAPFFARYADSRDPERSGYLIVTRNDLFPFLRALFGHQCRFFLYNTNSTRIVAPISNHIINTFCEYFSLTDVPRTITASDYLDFPIDRADRFSLAGSARLLVLNNYVDSGRHRISRGMSRHLLQKVLDAKRDDLVVHLGSRRDLLGDNADYRGLVDLDLRGWTSFQDVFSIISLPNVRRVFCHDTAILHIANFFDKPVSVVFRRYFRPGENRQKRRAFASLYERDRSNIEFLD